MSLNINHILMHTVLAEVRYIHSFLGTLLIWLCPWILASISTEVRCSKLFPGKPTYFYNPRNEVQHVTYIWGYFLNSSCVPSYASGVHESTSGISHTNQYGIHSELRLYTHHAALKLDSWCMLSCSNSRPPAEWEMVISLNCKFPLRTNNPYTPWPQSQETPQ